MGNSIDHYFGAGLREERRWLSRAAPWNPQDTSMLSNLKQDEGDDSDYFSTASTATKLPRHFKFGFQACLFILETLYIRFSTRTVFNWQFQTIKFDLCLSCRVLATLRCHRFSTVQNFKFNLLKSSKRLVNPQVCSHLAF